MRNLCLHVTLDFFLNRFVYLLASLSELFGVIHRRSSIPIKKLGGIFLKKILAMGLF